MLFLRYANIKLFCDIRKKMAIGFTATSFSRSFRSRLRS